MESKKQISNPRMHNPDGVYASQARDEDFFYMRDYFANSAMQALVGVSNGNVDLQYAEYLSNTAYKIADAMLKERSKTNE